MTPPGGHVLALSGGIGGAKLALGLQRSLAPGALTVVANTGDDFDHLGLAISPDIDTLTYTLAGLDNPETGWGRRDESWNFMAALAGLGGPDWFRLGDRDLAIHVERTRRLAAGERLSAITADFSTRLGIPSRILPMSDDRVRTRLRSDDGWLDFQDYFVARRCAPIVREIAFDGAATARPHPEFLAALTDPRLRAVAICPSNPLISIDPILALPGVRPALAACTAPIIAVAPVIGGHAVKGPTAKMMRELGMTASAAAVAQRYRDVIDLYLLDPGDADEALDVPTAATRVLMETPEDREGLARTLLDQADAIAPGRRRAGRR